MLTKEARLLMNNAEKHCHDICMSMLELYMDHHFIDEDGKKLEIPILEDLGDEEWGKSGDHVSACHRVIESNIVLKTREGKKFRKVMDTVIDKVAIILYLYKKFHKKGKLDTRNFDPIVAIDSGRVILNLTKENKELGWIVYQMIIKGITLAIPRIDRGDFKEAK